MPAVATAPAPSGEHDYALVGGGLQNGLIALALRARRPSVRIAMIEHGATIGGNHTWCFHAGDVAHGSAWLDRLVVARWPGYDVAFASHARRLASPYACVTSRRFAEVVAASLAVPGSALHTRTRATVVTGDRVEVEGPDGARAQIRAACVIDARGPDALSAASSSTRVPAACGWQTFVGLELELAAPHGLDRPIVMDATVPQLGGFRFFYVLPLGPNRLLVEDTSFRDDAALDDAEVERAVLAYAEGRGWTVDAIVRRERGVLPLPWAGTPPAPPAAGHPLVAGYAGGWFHPVTGYSFPVAARLAQAIAAAPPDAPFAGLDATAAAHARQLPFAWRLNRMLFHWYPPAERHHVLARFYRMPEATIARFFALEMTGFDRARFFLGRPPRGLSLRGAFGLTAAGAR